MHHRKTVTKLSDIMPTASTFLARKKKSAIVFCIKLDKLILLESYPIAVRDGSISAQNDCKYLWLGCILY